MNAVGKLGRFSPFIGCPYCEASHLEGESFKHEVGCLADLSGKTTSDLLAGIGASHQPLNHRRRLIVAGNGSPIEPMDCFEANSFVVRAHCAA